jgi:cyclophilin family peptidyl-prolyl cis-trans isomerase
VNQEKRQRQKAGRQARLEAEQKARKRKQNIRRVITVAIVAVIVVGLSYLIFKPSGSKSATTTTTTVAASTTTRPPPSGGSGNMSPSAITTSADCPASLSATLNKPSFSAPPMTIDPSKTYTATVTTDLGPFTVQLDPKTAPKATNSFVYLADKHFYDCIVFHRVIQTFMNQTGDPTGTGSGGPGYQFTEAGPSQANPQYPVGSVAMANSNNPATTNPTTNGSQFFIVTGPEGESLAPDYTLFGKVTSGMDVLDKINADGSASTSQTGTPTKMHRMISVTISVS